MNKKTLTLTEVAQHIGVNKRTLYRMLDDNRFPVKPIPRTSPRIWFIADVNAWLTGQYVES